MSAQPEALRVADFLDREWRDNALNYDTALNAAAELRRLHEVNQYLEMTRCGSTQIDRLTVINQMLLEALQAITDAAKEKRVTAEHYEVARAAIANATESKS